MIRIFEYIARPNILIKRAWQECIRKNFTNWVPDKLYLKLRYRELMGNKLDLEKPQTLNEKIQWLKIYDKNANYCALVDKYNVRDWVKQKIGANHLIPLLGVWDAVEDIDFDSLPNSFVLKCTHGSRCNIICKDKKTLSIEETKDKLSQWMRTNYYYHSREWPYKHLKPRVVAEQYMTSMGYNELIDYKFYCFNGEPYVVMICEGRDTNDLRFYYFDEKWTFYRYNKSDEDLPADFSIPMPSCMPQMFQFARILAKGIPFVRVDLYESSSNVYFGEMTFYPSGGFDLDILKSTDLLFGSKLTLPTKENL